MIKTFIRDERGATAIEYGLICALIFLGIVTAIGSYSEKTDGMYNYIGDTIDEAIGGETDAS
ncbi:Flp family type IVb pilin [Asticcacaulis endophyticus]|jgi:pilus assembly protein Flp/PilA|uniref:Fimbrial protein n=1 Tax=Asticcacaulis endophyticus TaxID=1395890 RepID=A0A918UMB2_9CAUL|nr:Flp family type IVb pilin [Asticcacaulis endophyticus]GGZ20632.1 fimbrial protein [Asticcacaulis endophyticus]